MRLKELLYLLGMPRPAPKTYGHQVHTFDLPKDGPIEYAEWLHPKQRLHEVRQETVDSLRSFLRAGDVVVDIGAHTGDTSVPFAVAVGPSGAVLAFEPNPYVFPVLEKNATLNRERTRIVPFRRAIGTEDGKLKLEYGDEGFCNGGRHEDYSRWQHGSVFEIEAPSVRLEPFLQAHEPDLVDRIRLIKVDAEGYDHYIIDSIRPLIARLRPFIKTEIFVLSSKEQRLAHINALRSLGYRVTRMRDDDDYPGVPLEDADIMKWRSFDVFCTPV